MVIGSLQNKKEKGDQKKKKMEKKTWKMLKSLKCWGTLGEKKRWEGGWEGYDKAKQERNIEIFFVVMFVFL